MKFLFGLALVAPLVAVALSCHLCNLNGPSHYGDCGLVNPKPYLAMKYPLIQKLKLCLCNKICGTPIPPALPPIAAPLYQKPIVLPLPCVAQPILQKQLVLPPAALPCAAPPLAVPCAAPPAAPCYAPAAPAKMDLATLTYLLGLVKKSNALAPACLPQAAPLLPALGGASPCGCGCS